jgi:hypothetical protein
VCVYFASENIHFKDGETREQRLKKQKKKKTKKVFSVFCSQNHPMGTHKRMKKALLFHHFRTKKRIAQITKQYYYKNFQNMSSAPPPSRGQQQYGLSKSCFPC